MMLWDYSFRDFRISVFPAWAAMKNYKVFLRIKTVIFICRAGKSQSARKTNFNIEYIHILYCVFRCIVIN